MEATCKQCKFAMVHATVITLVCRRMPPIDNHKWPSVPDAGWCGEWKPIEAPKRKPKAEATQAGG
jgi:hypothetical protein